MFDIIESTAIRLARYLSEDLAQEGKIKFTKVLTETGEEKLALVAAINHMKTFKRHWEFKIDNNKASTKIYGHTITQNPVHIVHYREIFIKITSNLTPGENDFIKAGFNKKRLGVSYATICRRRKTIRRKIKEMGLEESDIF